MEGLLTLIYIIIIAVLVFITLCLAIIIPFEIQTKKRKYNGISFGVWLQHNCTLQLTMFENRPIWRYKDKIYDTEEIYKIYQKIR